MNIFEYFLQNKTQIISLLIEHIELTAISVGLAILIGVPLGILISYVKKLNKPILGMTNIIQAIPSMALLGLFIPLLGIGTLPAVTTVVLYSLLPIIKNTYTGISNINPQTIEAAKGIGLTKFQILTKIQIPLALPIIMAGVRISSVTAVGLMTIASFIGAGGLGYLVFSGIRTVNNNQILAGAIPACLLALVVDFLAGTVEKLVTPISLQKVESTTKKDLIKTRKFQKRLLAISSIFIILVFLFSSIAKVNTNSKSITVGSKDYSEQVILGHMVADLIEENTDISVNRKVNLGGTQVCFSALKSDDIDLYIEYSGTAYGDTLGYPPISDVEKIYDTVKNDFKEKYDIEVLKQIGFNNTYALAVKEETAKKYNLESISDLSLVASNLKSGTTLEFLNRDDGLPGLTKEYNFTFNDSIGIDGSSRYTALVNDKVDVVDAFATDGLLKKFGLKTLKDDKNFFPPYYAMPIVRSETVEEFPEIVPLLEELSTVLNDTVMMELNYKVDELQIEPKDVAREFLEEQGLI
ncbi:glycine betaine ABC transporter substrate-binding protein [Clostridium sp.]|uniref:ABC transporter permease/substrate-binding protein n=1 Tax=Clostridium sp. TaxID=1506 RepID=UPI00321773C7